MFFFSFFRKQCSLYFAILEPMIKNTKVFVNHVLSDNALSQYKNEHSFGLLESLADEFNLQIICTYGAAGHGKGESRASLDLVLRIT